MQKWNVPLLVVGVVVLFGAGYFLLPWGSHGPVPSGMPTAPPSGPGWVDLLDADHVAGWKNITDDLDIFEITKDKELHIFGKTIHPLRYAGYEAERFGDFDLHLEFKCKPGANSGVFLRTQKDDPTYRGWEVQVLEDFGKAPDKNSCGSIYDVTTPMYNMSRPAGEWNSYDIHVHGGDVEVIMNGWRVIHTDLDLMTMNIGKFSVPHASLPREGLLALQDHGGEVWYRNIFIRPAAPAAG